MGGQGSGNVINSRSPSKAARGFVRQSDGGCYRRIVISLDDETFDAVVAMATKRGKSFASVARELIEFGLIDAEEAA